MAIPTVAALGAYAAAGSTTDLNCQYPAGIQADDILLYIVECRWPAGTMATPAGWTNPLGTNGHVWNNTSSSTTECGLWFLWRRATGSESGNAGAFNNNDHASGRVIAVRGCVKSGSPIDTTAESGSTVETKPQTWAGLTTLGPDRLILLLGALNDDDHGTPTATNANLANITNQFSNGTALGDDGTAMCITGEKAAAGAIGTTSIDFSGLGPAFAGLTVALIPDLPADPTVLRPRARDLQPILAQ